jgi:rod shape-determining protein MreC
VTSLTHYLSRRAEVLILILLVVISITLMLLSSTRKETVARSISDAAVTPVQSMLTTGDRFVGLREENDFLRAKLAEATVEIARLREGEVENERLRSMLEIRPSSSNMLIGARVIAHEATRAGRELKIDKGSQDGLRTDLCVITPDGLVGKISRVAPRSAFIRPLLARHCRVSARIGRSRAEGILEWKSGSKLELSFLPFRADAKVGDEVITTGLGGVYPRGIPVGTVSEVTSDPKSGAAGVEIDPACDFSSLEEVFVVIGNSPFESSSEELPPEEKE